LAPWQAQKEPAGGNAGATFFEGADFTPRRICSFAFSNGRLDSPVIPSPGRRQVLEQMPKIGRRFAVNIYAFPLTGMNKPKMRSVQRHAIDQPLRRFFRTVLPIAYHRVADGRELRADLVLQTGHQFDPDQRGIVKDAFDPVTKFAPGRLRVLGRQ
jgi:hypothetical protein